jgi:hypothetical protein
MAPPWRVAHSLDKLLAQLNGLAPFRSKASDGSIGDAAHASRDSDHNPWFVLNGEHLVTARDFTHDPANGLDCGWLAETLVASRDPRIKYIIWNRKIIDSRPGNHPWKWLPYNGINPHNHHLHLSVMDTALADDTRAWALTPYLPLDDDMTPEEHDALMQMAVQINSQWPSFINPTWKVTPVDYIRFADQHLKEIKDMLAELLDVVRPQTKP